METKTKSNISSKKLGIIHLVLSSFSFALMSLFISLTGDVPVFEKAFFRNFVALLMSLVILARSEDKFKVRKGSWPGLFLRAFFGTIGLIANFYAVSEINISDAMMLNKLSPFFAIIASIFILKERATIYQWFFIFMAIVGAVFVVKPSFIIDMLNGNFSSGGLPALIGLIGGISAGVAYSFLRKVSNQGERSMIIICFFSLFSCVALIPPIIMTFQKPTLIQLLFMFLTGCAALCGQMNITKAYAYAPAKEISVYDYSGVIFAAILGMIFLGEKPDLYSIIGYMVIIGASVLAFMYNNGYLTKTKGES